MKFKTRNKYVVHIYTNVLLQPFINAPVKQTTTAFIATVSVIPTSTTSIGDNNNNKNRIATV